MFNVLADRATLKSLTHRFLKVFDRVEVLATNPNYMFYLFKNGGTLPRDFNHESLAKAITGDAKILSLVSNILKTLVIETEKHKTRKVLLGWFNSDEFLDLLEVVKYV